jgi:hypothetical protein
MPGEHAHLGQAEHNLNFFAAIDRKSFSDWAATVLFYAALHYVDAYLFCVLGVHPSGHGDRDAYVNRVADLKPVRDDYRELKDCCHNARYRPPTRFSETDLAELKDINLAAILNAVKPHLTPPPSKP